MERAGIMHYLIRKDPICLTVAATPGLINIPGTVTRQPEVFIK